MSPLSSRVAKVEDVDDATGEPLPDTTVEAKRSSKQKLTLPTANLPPGPASDSGYSSAYANSAYANNGSQLSARDGQVVPARRPSVHSPSKNSKRYSYQGAPLPADHYSHDREHGPTETNTEWRYTLPERHTVPPQSPRAAQPNSNTMNHYPPTAYPTYNANYATQMGPPPLPPQTQHANMQVPPYSRPRTASMSNSRPVSYHAGESPRGPPPSNSAYFAHNVQPHAATPMYAYPPSPVSYFPPGPVMSVPVQAPVQSPYGHYSHPQISPVSPSTHSAYPPRSSSTMQPTSGFSRPPPQPHVEPYADPRANLTRTTSQSVRHQAPRPMAALPPRRGSECDSDCSSEDEHGKTALTRTNHRPHMSHAATHPVVPRGILRRPSEVRSNEARRRETTSDAGVEYYGEQGFPDRMPRAVDARHPSTLRGSSRHLQAELPQMSSSDTGPRGVYHDPMEEKIRVQVQDEYGEISYRLISRRKLAEKEHKAQKRQEQEMLQAERLTRGMQGLHMDDLDRKMQGAEQYVKASGTDRINLTAQDVRDTNDRTAKQAGTERRRSNSHVSGYTQQSRQSGSHMTSSRGKSVTLVQDGQILTLNHTEQQNISLDWDDNGHLTVKMKEANDPADDNASFLESRSGVGRRRSGRQEDFHGEGGYERPI